MNLRQQITPKNDNGSIDHRYVPIAKAIAELAGKRVEAQLHKLYVETNKLEKESATAGLQLVIALFSIPMDERFERSKFKKHIREQLQEIGFKPSKVSKLMGAGEFYARNHDRAPTILGMSASLNLNESKGKTVSLMSTSRMSQNSMSFLA